MSGRSGEGEAKSGVERKQAMDRKLRKAGKPLPVCETVQKRFLGLMLRLDAYASISRVPLTLAASVTQSFTSIKVRPLSWIYRLFCISSVRGLELRIMRQDRPFSIHRFRVKIYFFHAASFSLVTTRTLPSNARHGTSDAQSLPESLAPRESFELEHHLSQRQDQSSKSCTQASHCLPGIQGWSL